MWSCSNVKTASKNKNTQLPMEWYMDVLDLCDKTHINSHSNSQYRYTYVYEIWANLTKVSLIVLLHRIYYWKSNRPLVWLRPTQFPNPLRWVNFCMKWKLNINISSEFFRQPINAQSYFLGSKVFYRYYLSIQNLLNDNQIEFWNTYVFGMWSSASSQTSWNWKKQKKKKKFTKLKENPISILKNYIVNFYYSKCST